MQDYDDDAPMLSPTELVKETHNINSLRPSQNHTSASKPLPSSNTQTKLIDDVKVNKAIAFLRSNEIQNITLDEKRKYLQTKVGLTTDEINMAFEKVAMDSMDHIANNEGLVVDEGTRGYGAPTNNNNQQLYQNNNKYGPHRRPPLSQQQYNNIQSDYSDGRDHEGTSSSSLPTSTSLVGGFSLGIFCLAAIRWLNGGDFVLFPPPSTESNYTEEAVTKRDEGEGEARLLSINEGDTVESDSQGQEDEELQDDRYEGEEGEDGEYEEGEYEDQEDENEINMILNGTSDAASYHPTNNNNSLPQNNQQPSYEELVIEIRALTSAIHSYRDVQERANRAVHAHVGKGLTDDAMDFLRQKKSSTEVSDDKKVSSVDEKSVSKVAAILMEVSNDLLQIKQSIVQDNTVKEDLAGDESDKAKKVSNSEASESAEDAVNKEEGEPLKRIDMAMDKIQELLAIVEKKVEESEKNEKVEEGGQANDPNVTGNNSYVAKEEEIETTKIVDEFEVPATSSAQTDEKSELSESPEQQQVPSNSETEETGEQQQQKQLEDTIKTLGSSANSVDDLKVGAQILYLYCLNISKNPTVPRYRKIYTNNNTFRKKVGVLVGAKEFLSAVGFVERTNFFEWSQSTTDDTSLASKSRLDFALVALELLKNGTKTKEDDDKSLPLVESKEIAPEANELLSDAGQVSADIEEGIELN